jgi:hypothetical protein
MAKFVYIYTGGSRPESEEEGKKVMDAWMSFMGGLGDAIVDSGNPFGASASAGGGKTSNLSGYTVINASSIDDAVAKAKACPIFDRGGDVEVYETIDM